MDFFDKDNSYVWGIATAASLTCPECKKGFPKIKTLQKHQRDTKHGLNHCPGCERIFYSIQALQQHQKNTGHSASMKQKDKSRKTKQVLCTQCNRKFFTPQAMEQPRGKKHRLQSDKSTPLSLPSSKITDIQPKNPTPKPNQKPIPKQEGIVDKIPVWERIINKLRLLIHRKKVLILDEMLGNGSTIQNFLDLPYEIRSLPSFLKGFPDRDLRLALAQQRWGLVTKDFEMALLAFKMQIRPVYFLAERRGNTVLIRLSRKNLQFVKSSDPLKES